MLSLHISQFAHDRHEKGKGGKQTVVQQVSTPAPAPPAKGEAAKNIAPSSVIRGTRRQGRMGTMLAPRGTLQDQVKNLLGI